MPLIQYVERKFNRASLDVIDVANSIVTDYAAQGFSLTLRQLYYQFVARGIIANRQSEYSRLGSIVNDARLAGLIDWYAIEDRTRWLRASDSDSGSVEAHLLGAAESFSVSRWSTQEWAPEVWIEKDALVGIVESVCVPLAVPYFACRGYVSQSEVWLAAQRAIAAQRNGKKALILHLGDHDPSGLDMTRDLEDRLALFCGGHGFPAPEIVRLALNIEQVEELNPPPNPTKFTDSRAASYAARFGDESWELDAIDPTALAELVRENLEPLVEATAWRESEAAEERGRETLRVVAKRFDELERYIVEHPTPVVVGDTPERDKPPFPGAKRDIDGNWG